MKTRILVLFLTISLALAACKNGDALTADQHTPYGDLESLDPDGALVVYWHTLSGSDEDHLLDMIDDFNASNEWAITVVGEYQGDLATLHEKVLSGLHSNQLPDLVLTNRSLAAVYAAQDTAVALSPYLESKKWGFTSTEQDDFFPGALASERLPQFNDQLFGLPLCRSLQILYYNADWLKDLGYDSPPQTWDEFRDVACAAAQPADDLYLYGFEFGMDGSLFTDLLATQGASLLNTRATAYTLGGGQGRAALQFLNGLIQDGCALWETEQGPIAADFSAGKVLFAIGSTDDLPAFGAAIVEGADFVSTLPHTTDEPLLNVRGASPTMLRSTPKEQLAAWLFIKWLAEPEQQARWSQQGVCFPTRRSALEEMGDYIAEHPQFSLVAQLLEAQWVAEPGVAAYAACRAEIGRMLYAVTAGESLNQWLADTRTYCNQALSDAME